MNIYLKSSRGPGLINKGAPTIYFWNFFLKNNHMKLKTILFGSRWFCEWKRNFYRPQWSCGNVMSLHLSVILFTMAGEGVSLNTPLDREHPHPLQRAPYWNGFLFKKCKSAYILKLLSLGLFHPVLTSMFLSQWLLHLTNSWWGSFLTIEQSQQKRNASWFHRGSIVLSIKPWSQWCYHDHLQDRDIHLWTRCNLATRC